MQPFLNEKFYLLVYEPLNMPLICDRFWLILCIEKKKIVKNIIFDLANLKQYFCN